MTRKKKPLPLLENITITDFAAEGKALARVDDMVVFVPWAVPGDVCDLQVRRKKHSFMEAEIACLHTPSPLRIKPFCQHFGVCGGCKWQQLPYEEQLKMKQQQVYDQLTRIGKVALPEFRPILGSVKTREYRNKLDFGCANKRWLTSEELKDEQIEKDVPAIGFHITGAFDKILPIEKCWLMDDVQNQIRNEICNYAIRKNISFFDLRQQVGLLRDVIIRNSNTGELMVIVQFHYDEEGDEQKAQELLQHVADTFPQITSLMYLNNQKCNDTIGDQEILTFKGNDHIYETMEELRFKVGPKSFYQTNTEQAYHLYCVAREFAFGSPLTLEGQGEMKDILTDDFIAEHGRPDVIITDPPRAGMHPDVVKTILKAAPQRIVYVSCNPATQARDLQELDSDYQVVAVQPVDMFPHTPHVENVVLLNKR